MLLDASRASDEMAVCHQETGTFGKPITDCGFVAGDPDIMTGSSQRQCELGTPCLLESSRDIFKML
jgi:hypothetical protein